MNGIVAVKNYGFEWYLRHGLSEADAAAAMVRHGIDWVAVQNLRDPLPTSAVVQDRPGPPYEDRRFREALKRQGLKVFEATAVLFRPDAYEAVPDLRPVDADGRVMERFGWYVGLCPTSEAYLAERSAVMEEVVSTLEPDGVFLSFIRFPGFWASCGCPRRHGPTSSSTASANRAWLASRPRRAMTCLTGPPRRAAPSSSTSCAMRGRPGSAASSRGSSARCATRPGGYARASRCSSTAWRSVAVTMATPSARCSASHPRPSARWPTTSSSMLDHQIQRREPVP